MSLYHKGKEIGGFPDIDTVVTSDSNNPVSSKAVYNAMSEKASDIAINKSTLGYTCKNLLTYPYLYTTRTIQGVDWIDNGDGTVTVSGTNTDTTALSIFNCVTRLDTTMPLFLEAGTYILNGCPSGGSNSTYCIQVGRTKNKAFDRLGYDYGEGVTFTLEETTQIQVQLMVGIGATVDNITFKPMLRYAEIEDETWEQYIPSVRTEIDNTKSSIALNKSTLGYTRKNLLRNTSTSQTTAELTAKVNEDGSITLNGTPTTASLNLTLDFTSAVPKEDLILSLADTYVAGAFLVAGYFKEDGTVVNEVKRTNVSTSLTFPDEAVTMRVYLNVQSGNTYDNVTVYPMIRYADIEDDAYEAYTPSVDTRLDEIENTMCTTAVANKTATEITLDETYAKVTDGGNASQYMIKNGVCYISLDFIAQSDGSYTISNLPKSEILLNEVITPFKSTSYVESGAIVIGLNGLVALHNLVTGQRYLTQISYPVAE